MSNNTIFQKIMNGQGPIRNFIRQNKITDENIQDEQTKTAQDFIDGLAQQLDISSDVFDIQAVKGWLLTMMRAFVKSEDWNNTIQPTSFQMQKFGEVLGTILTNANAQVEQQALEEAEPIQEVEPEAPAKEPIVETVRSNLSIDT